MVDLKSIDCGTCRGGDGYRLYMLCESGPVTVRAAAENLHRSIAYTRSVAEQFEFRLVKTTDRVGDWQIGRD